MKAVLILSALAFAGIGSTYLAQGPELAPPAVVVVETQSPLERARQATCDIDYSPTSGGSAVLISRVKLEDGSFRYRALTAYHVMEEMAHDIAANGENASLGMLMTFQPSFHGDQFQINVVVISVDAAAPANDWASFTFTSDVRLECAPVATRVEFEQIQAFEHVYLIACYGPYGQQCREGVISATHNTATYPQQQLTSNMPWNQNPQNFFRFSMPIWYGDSGGPVFNKDGKVIGITNAFTISNGLQQVTHSATGLKTYIVVENMANIKDFFLIED